MKTSLTRNGWVSLRSTCLWRCPCGRAGKGEAPCPPYVRSGDAGDRPASATLRFYTL